MCMGKLEDAIRALERYEKNPTEDNKRLVAATFLILKPDMDRWNELTQRFTVRVQAENLGWMIVENME